MPEWSAAPCSIAGRSCWVSAAAWPDTSPSARPWGSRCSTPGRTGSASRRFRVAGREVDLWAHPGAVHPGSQGPADPRSPRGRCGVECRPARGHSGGSASRGHLRLRRPRGPDDRVPVSPPAPGRGRDLGSDADHCDDGARRPATRRCPIAFGYHPYLRLPGVERSAWLVEIPVQRAGRARLRGAPHRRGGAGGCGWRSARIEDLRRRVRGPGRAVRPRAEGGAANRGVV